MKLNTYLSFFIALFIISCNSAQEQFLVKIEPFTITDAPGIHSYSMGKTSDEKWLILGGRIEGLHKMRPFEAFRQKENNKNVFLIDPENNKTWSVDLSVLPSSIFEQLQATNQEFYQRENTLYVIGGYGYSDTAQDHITYNNLTAIDIDGLANAIINKTSITSFFRQISDDNLAVTGGQLGYLNNQFYLCGGQYFEGRYNPMGPNHGPGFTQEYTNEIRKFEILDDGTNLSIDNYSANKDEQNLHRRDFNMVPQIFPDSTKGFTMFSGVFQYDANIPWLNSVDVKESGYKVNNDFNQLLSQYHSAKVPMFDSEKNNMYTIFFGGMSQFQFNENKELIKDDDVPFVKTISMVIRSKNGTMLEKDLGIKMPGFLGSGAEFIPSENQNMYLENGILNFNKLKKGNNLVGYIYGGIESIKENIFFNNNGSQSKASSKIFKVYVYKN
ncbi:T9SS C-terminal target domain-containing protein [Lacinutrix sp. Bg11-31]|uniref:T9SS C-terminal target domain-containing protein n=1 Tax=Lacinutrix sp. Bg11-31 TaxID=2057808 RepID=UPI000C313F20|nr:T9SS C-terminal target domain-containing protein [Lacinutrix sp. Bg11-31]AUC81429.1 T9SS C-terminal target domain-containing protein [Lacinutrix sp. Bg11-31]